MAASTSTSTLTLLQLRLLRLLAAGCEREMMAIKLGVSYHRAKSQLAIMYRKLGADNGSHAVSIGYQMGILKVGEWPHD